MQQLISLLIFLLLFTFGNNQVVLGQKIVSGESGSFIIGIKFTSNIYEGYTSEGYIVIDISKLDQFKIGLDTIPSTPKVPEFFMENGGAYLDINFMDFYTLGCCEYGDVNKGIIKYFDKEIPKAKLNEYSNVEHLQEQINRTEGLKLSFMNDFGNYHFTIWTANLNYCLCKLYLGTAGVHFGRVGKPGAYLTKIESIGKPSDLNAKLLKSILAQMIAIERAKNKQ